jgi:hypothetical protein
MAIARNEQLVSLANPNLPLAEEVYSRYYQDQLNSVLRLYFNRLNGNVNRLLGPNGGQFIDCPNGLFFSTTDQPIVAANVGQPVDFPLEYLNNEVFVNSGTDSRIYVGIGGVYNFQFSGQLQSKSSSAKQVYIWIARNGTDIGYSTHQYTVSGNNVHLNISWNFNIDLAADEYVELRWASNDVDMALEAVAPTAPHPGMPSAVMAVNFIAPLPSPRPVAP